MTAALNEPVEILALEPKPAPIAELGGQDDAVAFLPTHGPDLDAGLLGALRFP